MVQFQGNTGLRSHGNANVVEPGKIYVNSPALDSMNKKDDFDGEPNAFTGNPVISIEYSTGSG